jgi:signal transduction histidine kinase/CheY-like chemotaxis protein
MFVGGSAGVLISAALLLFFFRYADTYQRVIVVFSFAALIFFPTQFVSLESRSRTSVLDLYFVLLITTPALIGVWRWQVQSIASACAVIAAAYILFPWDSWGSIHSIMLVSVAALVASLVVRFRLSLPYKERYQQLLSFTANQFAEQKRIDATINVMLLQVGLLATLIFLDLSLHPNNIFEFVIQKVYGLVALALGLLVVRASAARIGLPALLLTTLLVGVLLSSARLHIPDAPILLSVLPLVYLMFLSVLMPFGVGVQLALIWGLLTIDLLMKISGVSSPSGFEAIGLALLAYRSEVGFIVVGGLAASGTAWFVQKYRFENLSNYLAPIDSDETAELEHRERVFEYDKAEDSLEPMRRRSLITGMLFVGILSSGVSSNLILNLDYSFGMSVALTWAGFMVSWALLLYFEPRRHRGDYFWFIGTFMQLLLFIWPCILLLLTPDGHSFWPFWPCCLLLSLGLIPWKLREVMCLLLVAGLSGVEVISRVDLLFWQVVLFPATLIFGVLLWMQVTRRLKESVFSTRFSSALEQANSETEILLCFADHAIRLLGAHGAICVAASQETTLLRAGHAFGLDEKVWPQDLLYARAEEVPSTIPHVSFRRLHWIPPELHFFDERFGLFAPRFGMFVEFRCGESVDGESVVTDRVFLALSFSMSNVLSSTDARLPEMLASVTRLHLERLYLKRARVEIAETFEGKFQEREYELGALVHDINNTVQDMTLLCDEMLEGAEGSEVAAELPKGFVGSIRRIALIARSVATVVSDAKRKRELERMSDLRPRECVELTEVVKDIGAFASIRAERKRIAVELPDKVTERAWVKVSVREHLEAVLRNLLNNAIMYSDPGSTIELILELEEDEVSIIVRDDGPGLAAKELEAIFENGYRGESSLGIPGGLGLGLAESRRVTDFAGGTLTASSDGPGTGSSFTLKLPRIPAPNLKTTDAPWSLVVDDQSNLTDFYSKVSKALEFLPRSANSVEAAISIVEEFGTPGFVITDIHLGPSNGLDLVRYIRGHCGSLLPILVVSGLPDEDIAQQARLAGASDFLAKPVRRRALFARIQSLLP